LAHTLSDREVLYTILSTVASVHLSQLIGVTVHQPSGAHWQTNRQWYNQVTTRVREQLTAAGMNRDVYQYYKEQLSERQDDFISSDKNGFTDSNVCGHSSNKQIDTIDAERCDVL